MTSSVGGQNQEAYVWLWLPNETKPVVAGRLAADGGNTVFNYGRSYLQRVQEGLPTIPIYEPELPLVAGVLPLPNGMSIPSSIRDAAPDAWGRRVILNRLFGRKGAAADTAELGELTYLLESGSDRIGALDFQRSPTHYEERSHKNATLEELLHSAERVEQGIPLSPALDQALFHGTSIGGARPKVLIEQAGTKYIAKFSTSADLYSVVKAEFIAMRLAAHAGINVAPVSLVQVSGKSVLLVERFDRHKQLDGWTRRPMVSTLTILGLDEMMARYASYEDLADIIRARFMDPRSTLRELFKRIAFNILCGNTDDHARNHAAFWDGDSLELTPAYDICPQPRAGNETSQAMLIHGADRSSRLQACLQASESFLLPRQEAQDIFTHLISTIERHWDSVCEQAELSRAEKNFFWKRQFLNPYAMEY